MASLTKTPTSRTMVKKPRSTRGKGASYRVIAIAFAMATGISSTAAISPIYVVQLLVIVSNDGAVSYLLRPIHSADTPPSSIMNVA